MNVIRRHFSLFEVILALVVISVAVMAVLGVFPISMRMHNNAMRQTQAADIAEELLSLAVMKVKQGSTFPSNSVTLLNTIRTTSALDINSTSPSWDLQSSGVEGLTDSKYYYYDGGSFESGIIRVLRTHTAHRGDRTAKVTELDVVFAIYESTDSRALYMDSSTPPTDALTEGHLFDAQSEYDDDRDVVRITIEASWPGSWEYSKRKKMTLVTEVLR